MLAQDLAVPRMFPALSNDALDAVLHADEFLGAPSNFSLTGFTGIDDPATSTTPTYNCSGCYGEVYLFQRYLHDRFGGDAYLAAAESGTNVGLAHLGTITGESPGLLLSDFGLTLAASGATADARYKISGFAFGTTLSTQFSGVTQPANTAATINPGGPGSRSTDAPRANLRRLSARPQTPATRAQTCGAVSAAPARKNPTNSATSRSRPKPISASTTGAISSTPMP